MTNVNRYDRRDKSKSQQIQGASSLIGDNAPSYSQYTSRKAHYLSGRCGTRNFHEKQRHSSDDNHNHRYQNHVQKGNISSHTKKRVSFQCAHNVNEEHYDHPDIDSISVTLSTVSCTSDDLSSFNAEESKDDRIDKCSFDAASVYNADYDGEIEDGYDTDNAVVCDTINLCSTKKDMSIPQQRYERPLDQQSQQNVKKIVEQLLREQTIAVEAWDEVATEYHRRIEPFTSSFLPHLLDPVFVSSLFNNEYLYLSGKSVLDVGAGTGAGAFYAASRGASSVMATDFSENMLQVLRSRMGTYHCHMMETQIANGLCLPLNWANKYDIVCSNFGVIYFSKVKEGLAEMVRCTKPGGRVCVSGWGSKEETQAFSVFPSAMKACGLDRTWYSAQSAARKKLLALAGIVPPRKKKYRGISITPNYFFPAKRIESSQYSLHSMMAEAGLGNIQVIPVTKELRLDSVERYWDRFVLASPNLKRFVEQCLSPEEVMQLKNAVSDTIHKEFFSHHTGGGVVLKASAYIAIGTKTAARKHQ